MGLELRDVKVPLRIDEHGVVRVIGSRIPLETLVIAFQDGMTPEQVVQDFPTLKLADVYAIFAFYLYNKAAVDEYVREQERIGDEIQRKMQELYPQKGIRERLLKRRKETA